MGKLRFEARHLEYAYGNGRRAVHDVSLTSAEGSMTAVKRRDGALERVSRIPCKRRETGKHPHGSGQSFVKALE